MKKMKIYVNEIPDKPEKCLFSRKFGPYKTIFAGEMFTIEKYTCSINDKDCKLVNGGTCNKLKRLPE